jgi:hypothetical protein
MTTDGLRAARGQLVALHQRFAPLFGRPESRAHSLVYLRGLLSPLRRKRIEPSALGAGGGRVVPVQRFLTRAPWQAQAVRQTIRAVFAEQLVPSTASWDLGTVGVLDASDFLKRGRRFARGVKPVPTASPCPRLPSGQGPATAGRPRQGPRTPLASHPGKMRQGRATPPADLGK